MPTYKAPLRDSRFAYFELFDAADLVRLPGYEEATPDLVAAVLEEFAKIAEETIQPLNLAGDEEGCHWENGKVTTPAGFREAYRTLVEGGWPGLSCDPDHGGQGLPQAVNVIVDEIVCSANMSFAMYLSLNRGAYHALSLHATDELKAVYMPQLAEGTLAGTMCLTEPQSGTDLGLVRTKAEPVGDGTYKISGNKIFVSAGEHDLTDNIVHLLLARLPDAPEGIKGISLFAAPKLRRAEDGSLVDNGVHCVSIEHKMGIKGSATCVLEFDGSIGHLVGEPHRGMRAMFSFMNAARLHVGVQGLALGEVANQNAVAFARERLQGRALTGAKYPDQEADPILVHPDVRRMLLTSRAFVEGCRALTAWVALEIDQEEKSPDPERVREANDFASLLTPVVKAFQTDRGFEVTNLALQVCGGYGYIHEQGMEQFVRDARITQIFEGTNGIQALDLVGRKLPAHAGRYLRRFFHPVQRFLEEEAGNKDLEGYLEPLAKAFGRLQRATAWLAQKGMANPDEAGAAASDYLQLFGYVALAYLWARAVKVSTPQVEGDEAAFYRAKLQTARFYYDRLLPRTGALFAAIMAGCESTMAIADEAF